MKIYKTNQGIVLEAAGSFFLLQNEDWDSFINDDDLSEKLQKIVSVSKPAAIDQQWLQGHWQKPIQSQEIWASGVTYFNSKLARQEESKDKGGGDFYANVYVADRPELFFKATAHRTVGPGQKVSIRKDSTWNVPEPELTLVITSSGKIVAYTIGNDMSSRSIEGENRLYLPQAKTYDGCAAVGPCLWVSDQPLPGETTIVLEILRAGIQQFSGQTDLKSMKRQLTELVAYLYRACSFPFGSYLMTGTGVVPPNDFTLQSGDEIRISIPPIGTLVNFVE